MKKLLILSTLCIGLISSLTVFSAPVYIKMETNRGDIFLELNQEKAPISVGNFVQYTKDGFYDGTIFHRVISNFMIQGGGYDADLIRKTPGATIQNEATNGLKNHKGTIAMARTNSPHSATSQFFINVNDNPALDHTSQSNGRTWGYTVFGKVIKGMDIVDEIRFTQTGASPPFRSDVPIKTMMIKKVSILEKSPVSEQKESALANINVTETTTNTK